MLSRLKRKVQRMTGKSDAFALFEHVRTMMPLEESFSSDNEDINVHEQRLKQAA